jgi:hypothetical protein
LNSDALDLPHFGSLMRRLPVLVWLFGAVRERMPGTPAEFACFLGDASFWPNVAFSANDAGACLVPDPEFFASGGYAEFRSVVLPEIPPWESRTATVFWRGATTGIKRYWPPAAPDDVRWLQRTELCGRVQSGALSRNCDVGLTNLVQIPAEDAAAVARGLAPFMRPAVAKASFAQFKAVIDVDGNSNAWSGLFTSLLTGACVIKIGSDNGFRQWYYDRLVPWVHYVPVRSDLSDLEEKVLHVLSDDAGSREIAAAGYAFARSLDVVSEMRDAAERVASWAAAS